MTEHVRVDHQSVGRRAYMKVPTPICVLLTGDIHRFVLRTNIRGPVQCCFEALKVMA